MTVSCCVAPTGFEIVFGPTAMEASVSFTVTGTVADLPEAVSVTVTEAVPTATAVTRPAAETVATAAFEVAQVRPVAIAAVLPSL